MLITGKASVLIQEEVHNIPMGKTDRVLTVQKQGIGASLWYITETDDPNDKNTVVRKFKWFATGQALFEEGCNYGKIDWIGTIQFDNLVFHLYELDRPIA